MRYKLILGLFLLCAVNTCNNSKQNEMINSQKESVWFNIPIAKIVFPIDQIYKYQTIEERNNFIAYEIDREMNGRIKNGIAYPEPRFLKSPSLSKENNYTNHILFEDYVITIVSFANRNEDLKEHKDDLKDLHKALLDIKNSKTRIVLHPLFVKESDSNFKAFILDKENYSNYAANFNWDEFCKEIPLLAFNLDFNRCNINKDSKKNSNIFLICLSKNFQNNPDVLENVKLE